MFYFRISEAKILCEVRGGAECVCLGVANCLAEKSLSEGDGEAEGYYVHSFLPKKCGKIIIMG